MKKIISSILIMFSCLIYAGDTVNKSEYYELYYENQPVGIINIDDLRTMREAYNMLSKQQTIEEQSDVYIRIIDTPMIYDKTKKLYSANFVIEWIDKENDEVFKSISLNSVIYLNIDDDKQNPLTQPNGISLNEFFNSPSYTQIAKVGFPISVGCNFGLLFVLLLFIFL